VKLSERGSKMTATNHGDQLGEIYPTMLNELSCTLGVSFSCLRCCGRHGHGLQPSWYRPEQTQKLITFSDSAKLLVINEILHHTSSSNSYKRFFMNNFYVQAYF